MSDSIDSASNVQGANSTTTGEAVDQTGATGTSNSATVSSASTFDGTLDGLKELDPKVWHALLESFGTQVIRQLNGFQSRSLQRQKEANQQK